MIDQRAHQSLDPLIDTVGTTANYEGVICDTVD